MTQISIAASEITDTQGYSRSQKLSGIDGVWLASYPRSGNTWMRFLLTNLLYHSSANSREIEQWIPDIHIRTNPEDIFNPKVQFVKTHMKLTEGIQKIKKFSHFIYLIRNPLDVLVSNLNYLIWNDYQRVSTLDLNRISENYINHFIQGQGDLRWKSLGFGTWNEHVASWLGHANRLTGMVIRYEDLLEDPAREMKHLCDFLDITPEPETLKHAIANSSFQKLKEIEQNSYREQTGSCFYSPDRQQAYEAGFSFLNRGKAGLGKALLSLDQQERAKQAFAAYLEYFGYL